MSSNIKLFGLLGKKLSHSFSKKYFSEKFENLKLQNYKYELFEIDSILKFPDLIANYKNFVGMNVTIPYKVEVMSYVDELDISAQKVGAINVIKFLPNNKLVGYNSDYYGFKTSLEHEISTFNYPIRSALILGTGGASKAVKATLEDLNISYQFVSRTPTSNQMSYEEVNKLETLPDLIINASPTGTYPEISFCPFLPYNIITEKNMLFDLVYNPIETLFMKKGKENGAKVQNGLDMLHLQAEKAWEIWNQ